MDAVNHVPRHRRKRLFSHFVEILGPADFLAPVCGLLVEKAALKYVKMQDTDLLVFPLALSGSFAADIQLLVSQNVRLTREKITETLKVRHIIDYWTRLATKSKYSIQRLPKSMWVAV